MKAISGLRSDTPKLMGVAVRGIVPWWKSKINASCMAPALKEAVGYPDAEIEENKKGHLIQNKDLMDIICHVLMDIICHVE